MAGVLSSKIGKIGKITFIEHDAARAIKITIPRPYARCDPDAGDACGGQQHGPPMEMETPD